MAWEVYGYFGEGPAILMREVYQTKIDAEGRFVRLIEAYVEWMRRNQPDMVMFYRISLNFDGRVRRFRWQPPASSDGLKVVNVFMRRLHPGED